MINQGRQVGVAYWLLIASLAACQRDFDFSQLAANRAAFVGTSQICRIGAIYKDNPSPVTNGEVWGHSAVRGATLSWAMQCGSTPVMVDFVGHNLSERFDTSAFRRDSRIRVRVTELNGVASASDWLLLPEWLRGRACCRGLRIPVVIFEGEH